MMSASFEQAFIFDESIKHKGFNKFILDKL